MLTSVSRHSHQPPHEQLSRHRTVLLSSHTRQPLSRPLFFFHLAGKNKTKSILSHSFHVSCVRGGGVQLGVTPDAKHTATPRRTSPPSHPLARARSHTMFCFELDFYFRAHSNCSNSRAPYRRISSPPPGLARLSPPFPQTHAPPPFALSHPTAPQVRHPHTLPLTNLSRAYTSRVSLQSLSPPRFTLSLCHRQSPPPPPPPSSSSSPLICLPRPPARPAPHASISRGALFLRQLHTHNSPPAPQHFSLASLTSRPLLLASRNNGLPKLSPRRSPPPSASNPAPSPGRRLPRRSPRCRVPIAARHDPNPPALSRSAHDSPPEWTRPVRRD